MPKNRLSIYCVIIIILLVQFALRAINPTAQAFFWDENRHITRAASILEGTHPAKESNGKFLLYVYLAPFHPSRQIALHVSRTAVALFSLIGSAAAFALARRLFGLSAALVAILFYAFVPFALFYERMVLADGMAGAIATLAAYACVRLAQKPSYRWAMLAGALAALASMAKVTVGFASVFLPILAGYTIGQHPTSQKQTIPQWVIARWRHYWWYWVAAGITYIVFWLPTLVPAFISGLQGEHYVLIDATSLDTSFLSENDSTRYNEFHRQIATMLSWPMLIAMLGIIGITLWKYPRRAWLLIGWIALIWVPTAVLVWRTQTRYLMAGVLPLSILLGGGTSIITQWKGWQQWGGKKIAWMLIGLFFVSWVSGFAAPFAYHAINDPTALTVTRWDNRDYFQSPWNGYGLLESLQYLQEYGQRGENNAVEVMMVAHMCPFMDLYEFDNVQWTCIIDDETNSKDYNGEIGHPMWRNATQFALEHDNEHVYLILEQHRNTLEIPTIPFEHPKLIWKEIKRFQRPHNGLWVTVWEVYSQ
ncbi:MAG: hypothetical protein CUN55_11055 [Phototrophicales bacterium]|nr:MAG: hypothetical protein CUN55_11055 [Phototrophicales bacterium]